MPVYCYSCESCKTEFETFVSSHTEPNPLCPDCGTHTKRMIAGGTDFILKGTGWYGKPRFSPRIGTKSGKNVKRFK